MQRDISNRNNLGDTLNLMLDGRQLLIEQHQTTMMPKKKSKKYEISLIWENMMLTLQNISQV